MSGLSDSKQTSSPSLSDTSLCLDDSKTTNFSDVKMLQNKLLETKAASTSMKFHLLDEVDGNTNKNDSKIIQKQISSGKKRNRTIYAPIQEKNYGPKATLKKVTDDYLLLMQDPLSQQLSWKKAPVYVLVIKKICNTLLDPFLEMIKYLIFTHKLVVYVEESEYENDLIKNDEQLKQIRVIDTNNKNEKQMLRKYTKNNSDHFGDRNKIDLLVCLGGDGTLLHASTLFQKSCPPVLSIHMGSLGFLCPFDFSNYKEYINGVIKGGVPLLLRNRLKCRLEKTMETSDKSEEMNNSFNANILFNSSRFNDSSYVNHDDSYFDGNEEWLSLNEVVVSRGPSPFLSNLDLYVNDYLITTVQGDGLIISTPTGSTAYAMAAGASMSHPSVPAIIIAPICPHSLSFRPIVVPAGVELKIALSTDSRHNAWYSIDGRNTTELKPGYFLSITTSEYPLPSICRSDQINDWFEGLAQCLHWNQRQKQLPLNACYYSTTSNSVSQSLNHSASQSQIHSSFSSSSSTSSLKQQSNTEFNDNQQAYDMNEKNSESNATNSQKSNKTML